MANMVSSSSFTPDNLIVGSHPIVTRKVTIKSGQNVLRGTIMGVDGDGKLLKSLAASSDGSETPHSILVRDVDASLADTVGEVYLCGQFNKDKVVIGTGHTFASILEGLRNKSIYLEAVSV